MFQLHPLFGITTRASSAPPLYQTLSQDHVEVVYVFLKASEAAMGSPLLAFESLITWSFASFG